MARVDFSGVQKEISLAYVPEAVIGDYVIVHVGFALQTIDEEEARRTIEMIEQMEEAAGEPEGGGTP
jgi:hydrogenase expression/formation protein HypC